MDTSVRRWAEPEWLLRVLVATSVLGWFTGGFPLPGSVAAQEPFDCDQAVVDTSGQLDLARVRSALASVDGRAIVVVRGFASVDGGDLEATAESIASDCFDKRDGTLQQTIMLSFSVGDRQSLVWVGTDWANAIPDANYLREDVLGPKFREGDYTGGTVDAINEIAFLVDRAPTGTTDDQGPASWPLLIGAALVVAGAGIWFVRRQSRLRQGRTAIARGVAGPTSRAIASNQRWHQVRSRAEVWERVVSGVTVQRLQQLLREAVASAQDVRSRLALLSSATPAGVAKASSSQLDAATDRVAELSRSLDAHEEMLDRLDAFGAHIDHLRRTIGAKRALLIREVHGGLCLVDERRSQGWTVTAASEQLLSIKEELDTMEPTGCQPDWFELSDQLEEIELRLFSACHDLQTAPARADSFRRWSDQLDTALVAEIDRVEQVRRRFQTLASIHARDSWQWGFSFPDLALEGLQRGRDLHLVALTESIPAQNWAEAGTQLEQAGRELLAASGLLDQVDDLLVDLEQAQSEASTIVIQGRVILEDLTHLVGDHDDDSDHAYRDKPAELSATLDELEVELQQVKPNYLRVAEVGEQTNRLTDGLLAKASDDKTSRHAWHRQAERELARAHRAVLRARRSLGWGLVETDEGEAIDLLQRRLNEQPAEPRDRALAAGDIADQALSVQERIIATRRRRSTWVMGSDPTGRGTGGFSGLGGGFGERGRGDRSLQADEGPDFGAGGSRSFSSGRSTGSF